MRLSSIQVCVIFLGLTATALPLTAQSVEDCQRASKLHAEQDVIKELFFQHGERAHAEGSPAIGRDPDSLQSRVRRGITACQDGGRSGPCGNYKRIRDAWLTNNTGGSPGAAMLTDPQTCEIRDPDTGETIDPARSRPSGGFEQANWNSQYEHEKFHQNNCRRLNGPGSNYQPGGPDSPYLRQMSKPRELAKEEGFAHGVTKDILEDYLRNNCFDPDLFVNAEPMQGKCGESPSGVAKIKSLAREAKSWVVNTPSKWLNIPTTGPVTTQAGGETEVDMRGNCDCCDATAKSGQVRVYGGPGHSILMGTDAANMGCAKGNECAGLSGDPHLRTYDGLRFDFQGAGEYVLARGQGFEVQARLEPGSSQHITIATGLAFQVNGDLVSMYAGRPHKLFVLGVETALDAGASIGLPGGGILMREEYWYRLTSPQGRAFEFQGNGHLAVKIGLPAGTQSVGLLGNFDKDRSNDLRAATGDLLTQPVAFEALYKVFGAGWRVTAETTLFDYAEGESVDTFYDPLFPKERVRARDIRGEARRKAEAACREAGVTGTINLDDCILDVGLTGDVEFAEIAATQPPDTARLEISGSSPGTPATRSVEVTGTATLTAAAEVSSGSPFALEWTGPGNDSDYVSVATPDDPASKYVSYRYTRLGSPVEMTAPDLPGEYELRYVQGQSREILATRRIEVTAVAATLTAPGRVAPGAELSVEWTGPGNGHDYVSFASPEDSAGKYDSYRYTRLGSPLKMKAPKEPGNYELRYIQGQSRTILVRRPIEVR